MLAGRENDFERSVSLYRQAIEFDPTFADAWLWLALMHFGNFGHGSLDISMVLEVADQALEEANKHMDNPAETSEVYNYVKALRLRRQMWAGHNISADEKRLLESSFKKAIELNPSRSTTYLSLALYYRTVGMLRDAEDQLGESLNRDPLYRAGMYQLSRILSKQGKFDESVALAKRIPELLGWGHLVVADRYRELSQFDESIAWAKMATQQQGQVVHALIDNHLALRATADTPGWQELISRSRVDMEDVNSRQRMEAWLLAVDGKFDAAYLLATDAIEELESPAWYDFNEPAALALLARRYQDAVRYNELAFENLRDPLRPDVNSLNTIRALELAFALHQLGDTARADVLFGRLLDLVEDELRLGYDGRRWTISKIVDVCVYASRGQTEAALAAMRDAVDQGWRGLYSTPYGHVPPMLASLEGNPEYEAMVVEINADLAVQRERIIQANGPLQTAVP